MDIGFEEVKEKLSVLAEKGFEPEFRIFLYGKEYMIIAYRTFCSFQRCGMTDGSGEIRYASLDELYHAQTIDGIVLEKDWNKIVKWECLVLEIWEQFC